ncbi:glycerol-3-phosphate acyltransferase 3 isoform X2 [Chrysoperla carnea]|uniref:glycerol-3-phosphate acyltransferase 3 isoform X2 n=1 Tax=Chrysoperla carnea TaxID=189513 RepID=UPI001D05D456|nr:glycerol-3-phosphate acyltransferase 3 isoform X2 [Chrysoperla carnea]
MALLATAVSVACSLFFTPFLMFILCIIFLASIGKSLGVRKLYVKILLTIFEYGRANIEVAKKQRYEDSGDEDEEEESTATKIENGAGGDNNVPEQTVTALNQNQKLNGTPLKHKNGVVNGTSNGNQVISRDNLILVPDPVQNYHNGSNPDLKKLAENAEKIENEQNSTGQHANILDFQLSNCLDLVKAGVEAIIEDQVTSRFEAEELKNWNLLTRTNRHYEFISWRLTVIWACGFCVRYFFLFPLRVLICFIGVNWLTLCTALVGCVPEGNIKSWVNRSVSIMCFGVLSRAVSAVINYHNPENIPKNGICVANHTSPIDVLILMCDNCYSLIGQRHGGFLGLLQRALARASPHIWFERSEVKDRSAVAKRLKEHVSNPKNPPILIFPEGTCINNTSVMQFKKGSFEVGGVIYPVAIKYDPRFGDAFWNSNKYSMLQYLYMMMTSWAIVCDVWYLPPMYQNENESAIDFANRVKSVIAKQGGLVDLMWDGQLKRMKPKKEWKELQQQEFSKRLKLE